MPVRIAGVNIPEQKQIGVGLTYIYGVGRALAWQALKKAKINPEKRGKDLSEKELSSLKKIIEEKYKIEGDLKREVLANIRRLKAIGSWRGTRHSKGLPVHGQKTRKNCRTVRGNIKKTVGSGRKTAPAPK